MLSLFGHQIFCGSKLIYSVEKGPKWLFWRWRLQMFCVLYFKCLFPDSCHVTGHRTTLHFLKTQSVYQNAFFSDLVFSFYVIINRQSSITILKNTSTDAVWTFPDVFLIPRMHRVTLERIEPLEIPEDTAGSWCTEACKRWTRSRKYLTLFLHIKINLNIVTVKHITL